MKVICAFCGFKNRADATNCAQCGQSLANARRERFQLPWASWLPAIPVAIFLYVQGAHTRQALAKIGNQTTTLEKNFREQDALEIKRLDEQFQRREAEEEAKHRSILQDKQIISGQGAAQAHALEWSKRQAHDPAFAKTLLERTLVDVERFGKDPALTAEAALKKVAEMIAPPGSRIEVTPAADRFNIRVAFRLSAVLPYEAGAATIHTSPAEMRKEIEQATARVVQELFDYCGARGIQNLSVSCNRAIDEHDQLRMRSVYRATIDAATASQVANWRRLSLTEVLRLVKVDRNLLPELTILTNGKPARPLDPNEPLEF